MFFFFFCELYTIDIYLSIYTYIGDMRTVACKLHGLKLHFIVVVAELIWFHSFHN